jgi:hypothetical protein
MGREVHKFWVNTDLEGAVVVYFKVLSRHSPGKADKYHKKS